MNYEELISAYEADVQFPDVSGMEHLDMLMTRSEIAGIEPHLSKTLQQRLSNADKRLMSQARQFYESIQRIANLASWRRSELAPVTHWWWYLDVVAYLPVRLETAPMQSAVHLIYDDDKENRYTLDEDKSADPNEEI